jgi:hypothetical protein
LYGTDSSLLSVSTSLAVVSLSGVEMVAVAKVSAFAVVLVVGALMEDDDDVNVEVPCPPPRRFSFSMIV